MTRRFPLRAAPAVSGGTWRQTIVMPPRAETPATDPTGPCPPCPPCPPGGDCGTPEIFVGTQIELFPGSDCHTRVVALHNLQPDSEVVWTVDESVSSPWNQLYGEDPATSTEHVALVVYCGGYIAVDVTVDGTLIGRYTEGDPE